MFNWRSHPIPTIALGVTILLLTACAGSAPPSSPSADLPTSPEPIEQGEEPAAQAETETAAQAPQTVPTPTTTPLSAGSQLTLTALGPVQIGMTIAQAEAATGQTFKERASGGEEYGCRYYEVEGFADVAFMVTEGAIARAEVWRNDITTRSGAKIGDSADKIRNLYPGQIEAEAHEYVPGGEYLIFTPQEAENRNYRVLFETNEAGEVTTIRSGKLPEVGFIEGCV